MENKLKSTIFSLPNGSLPITFYVQAYFSYDWISLTADIGGWTGTLIGFRYYLILQSTRDKVMMLIRTSLLVRASDCQFQSRNSPGLDLRIL
jgi:hypothetical protein